MPIHIRPSLQLIYNLTNAQLQPNDLQLMWSDRIVELEDFFKYLPCRVRSIIWTAMDPQTRNINEPNRCFNRNIVHFLKHFLLQWGFELTHIVSSSIY